MLVIVKMLMGFLIVSFVLFASGFVAIYVLDKLFKKI